MLLLFASARAARVRAWCVLRDFHICARIRDVWAGFSAGATLVQFGALHQAALLSAAMASSSGRLSGAILIAAGVYQLTPWKGKCLTHCRTPLSFLMTNWRDGTTGAFRMGFRHGVYCLGCCWALLCVLFVGGSHESCMGRGAVRLRSDREDRTGGSSLSREYAGAGMVCPRDCGASLAGLFPGRESMYDVL
jgi:predicted metal-binding membrane protein